MDATIKSAVRSHYLRRALFLLSLGFYSLSADDKCTWFGHKWAENPYNYENCARCQAFRWKK